MVQYEFWVATFILYPIIYVLLYFGVDSNTAWNTIPFFGLWVLILWMGGILGEHYTHPEGGGY